MESPEQVGRRQRGDRHREKKRENGTSQLRGRDHGARWGPGAGGSLKIELYIFIFISHIPHIHLLGGWEGGRKEADPRWGV